MKYVFMGLIRLYQWTISPLLGPVCRFYPSCSHYGYEAIAVHGAAKGSVLAAWRVLRCNPWNAGGVDTVPPRGRWRSAEKPDVHPSTGVADRDLDHDHSDMDLTIPQDHPAADASGPVGRLPYWVRRSGTASRRGPTPRPASTSSAPPTTAQGA